MERAPGIVLVAAVGVGLLVAVAAPEGMRRTHFGDYAPQVENLKAGRGLVDQDGRVMHRYPPLYPFLLFGLDRISERTGIPLYWVLAGFAVACHAAAAGIVWGMGRVLGLGPWRAAAGAAVFAVHPMVLYGILAPLSETPFMVVFTGGVMCLMLGMRGGCRWFVWGGLLLGAACLMRPIALLAPAAMGAVILWKGGRPAWGRLGRAGLVLAGFLVVVAPWVMWLRARSGEWVMVSSGGPPTLRDGLSFNHKAFRQKLDLPEGVKRVSDAAWAAYERLDSVWAYAGFMAGLAVRDPWAVAETYLYKAGRAWYGTDAQRAGAERFNLAVMIVMLSVVGMGMWRCAREGWPAETWLLVAGVAVMWGMATVALSIARYMMPVMPLLAVFVGYCLRERDGAGKEWA
jgi:hypothetical protein